MLLIPEKQNENGSCAVNKRQVALLVSVCIAPLALGELYQLTQAENDISWTLNILVLIKSVLSFLPGKDWKLQN